jgi:hypothetical protein
MKSGNPCLNGVTGRLAIGKKLQASLGG